MLYFFAIQPPLFPFTLQALAIQHSTFYHPTAIQSSTKERRLTNLAHVSKACEIFVVLSSFGFLSLFESSVRLAVREAVRLAVREAVRVAEIMSDQLNEVRSALLKVADRLSALQKASPQGK